MILKYQQFQHWAILLHLQLQVRLKIKKKSHVFAAAYDTFY